MQSDVAFPLRSFQKVHLNIVDLPADVIQEFVDISLSTTCRLMREIWLSAGRFGMRLEVCPNETHSRLPDRIYSVMAYATKLNVTFCTSHRVSYLQQISFSSSLQLGRFAWNNVKTLIFHNSYLEGLLSYYGRLSHTMPRVREIKAKLLFLDYEEIYTMESDRIDWRVFGSVNRFIGTLRNPFDILDIPDHMTGITVAVYGLDNLRNLVAIMSDRKSPMRKGAIAIRISFDDYDLEKALRDDSKLATAVAELAQNDYVSGISISAFSLSEHVAVYVVLKAWARLRTNSPTGIEFMRVKLTRSNLCKDGLCHRLRKASFKVVHPPDDGPSAYQHVIHVCP